MSAASERTPDTLVTPGACYIVPVIAADVADEIEAECRQALAPDATLYALHNETGERIAFMSSRPIAEAAARQYDLSPVALH